MPELPPKPRDWSGIGCAAFFLAFFLFVVCYRYSRQPDWDLDLVRQREDFASVLLEQGAILTLADASHPHDPMVLFSTRRLGLGDKPYYAIALPYAAHQLFVVERAKKLFPEQAFLTE